MENVRSYCDDILDVIHKFGEEYIYDPRTKIIDGKDLFVSVDIISITILHTLMIRTIDRMRLV